MSKYILYGSGLLSAISSIIIFLVFVSKVIFYLFSLSIPLYTFLASLLAVFQFAIFGLIGGCILYFIEKDCYEPDYEPDDEPDDETQP